MNVKEEQNVPANFFELSGLSGEMETLSYNEGGRNDRVHRLPTRMKHPNLVLKRGVTSLTELEKWFDAVSGNPEQTTVTLTMYDEGLNRIRGWQFHSAYPVKWTGPTFNVGQNQFATEAIEIAHEGIEVA